MTILDVLDLPQLYTKPSAESLLDTLSILTSAPLSWDIDNDGGTDDKASTRAQSIQINPEGVTRYLTSIVGSGLGWIDDDEKKEEIWNQASLRLSERSGRTAMSAMTRRFRIPSGTDSFELIIHEPALTGDDLGLKTWAASYLLAKRLHTLDIASMRDTHVLELGSGTGLVGLAMAGLGAQVVLTDLPSIYSNLSRNANDNAEIIAQNGGSTRTGILDWTTPSSLLIPPDNVATESEEGESIETKFPLILAADSLYSSEHPQWLVNTIETWLSNDSNAKVIVEFPLRDAYLPEVQDFQDRMWSIGLQILEEGEEQGYDDWGSTSRGADGDDDRALVTCWYSYWGRKSEQPT